MSDALHVYEFAALVGHQVGMVADTLLPHLIYEGPFGLNENIYYVILHCTLVKRYLFFFFLIKKKKSNSIHLLMEQVIISLQALTI